jgi:hypothetical protein
MLEQRNKENHKKTKFQTDPANDLKETSYNYCKKLEHSVQNHLHMLQVQSNYDRANQNPLQAQITPKHCLFSKNTWCEELLGTVAPTYPCRAPVQGQGPNMPGPGPAQARKGTAPSLNPADIRGVKQPRSLGAWLLSLRWVSAHLTSTFVTSCVTKVEVPPTSTTI